MPLSALDVLDPAIQHTKQQLLKPFRAAQWMRLAFVGLLAGEMGGGGCNIRIPASSGKSKEFIASGLPSIDPALLAGVIALLFVLGIILGVAFIYVNSRMRFVLFDSIVAKECHIRQYWAQRADPALRYFVWQIVFLFAMAAGLTILIGIPAAIALGAGWLKNPREHLAPLLLGGFLLFFVLFAYLVGVMVVGVFTKDFVVPRMALEDVTAFEGWRRLWPQLGAEKGAFAGYAAMKVVLAIGAAIVIGLVSFIVLLILLLPAGGLGVVAVLAAKAAGIGFNVYTITLLVVAGSVILAIVLYISSMIAVPAIVFFPAYSLLFFSSRYPALDALLHPAPPAPPDAPPFAPEPGPAL